MNVQELAGVVHTDPEISERYPRLRWYSVPLQNLIDCLKGGDSINEFLDGFPSVTREQAFAVIEAGRQRMLELV